MTRAEYDTYVAYFNGFMAREGLQNLSLRLDCQEPYFSWGYCEVCGRPEGGDRYDCNGWSERDKEVKEFVACEDCVYFAEYGRLDDTTMQELEE